MNRIPKRTATALLSAILFATAIILVAVLMRRGEEKRPDFRPAWSPEPSSPVESDLPDSGVGTLADILGTAEARHVRQMIYGLPESRESTVRFKRTDDRTELVFSTGWTLSVDNSNGAILPVRGLPPPDPARLERDTWHEMQRAGVVESWEGHDGPKTRKFRLDDIRPVADRVFVSWRLDETPPNKDGSFIRYDHWIDLRSGTFLFSGEELNEP